VHLSFKVKLINLMKDPRLARKKILWARNMLLDSDLFAKTETEVLHKLTDRGYEIFYMSGHAHKKFEMNNPRIHLFSIPLGEDNFPLKYHLIFALVQLFCFPYFILKIRPDYIIVDWDSVFSLSPMIPACRLFGIKTVLDIRSTPTPIIDSNQGVDLRGKLLSFIFDMSVQISKKVMSGITIITNLMKSEVCNKFSIVPNKIGVWTSGVSSELFFDKNNVQNGLDLKKKLGLDGKFVVFYHGAFSESRGIMDAINAMALLKGKCPEIVLFLLGKTIPQILGEMKNAIQENNVQESVIIHDSVDHNDVPMYIALSDVTIVPLHDLPQWRNQCPLKLLEYLASKKTVILSNIPCHREVIGDNNCGIFLKSTSAEDIAGSIDFAFANRKQLAQWGSVGQELVERQYTWNKVAERLSDYLGGLA
jgi:glycosyltransferase involved in cell wall biosynthesis